MDLDGMGWDGMGFKRYQSLDKGGGLDENRKSQNGSWWRMKVKRMR